jgi:dihydrofolate reductase
MNVTLDGYMSGPNCELDWHFKSWTKEMGDALCSQLSRADTILLGRITYSAMSGYWPSKVSDASLRGEDYAFANMMNSYAKIVFSTMPVLPKWNNSKFINGDLEHKISALKKRKGGDIIVYGSGKLVAALMRFNLVDEYHLWMHPVVLGRGKPFCNTLNERLHMKLVESKTFPSGVILLQYQANKTNNMDRLKPKTGRRVLKRQA